MIVMNNILIKNQNKARNISIKYDNNFSDEYSIKIYKLQRVWMVL